MIDKKLFFLSGLPRTGSTVLGSILSQNPDVHVTPTSPMYSLLVNTNEHFNLLNEQYTFDYINTSDRVYHAMIEAFYKDIEKPIIFDKHRGWPKNIPAISQYLNKDVRIVCTTRPIAEIVTSYIVLADKDPKNFIDEHLTRLGEDINNENRARLLWEFYLKTSYENMVHGLSEHQESILLVNYRDLCFRPNEVLKKVYEFCGLENYQHTFKSIENKCAEAKDEAWGLKDLHTIRPELGIKSKDPATYLSAKTIDYLNSFNDYGIR